MSRDVYGRPMSARRKKQQLAAEVGTNAPRHVVEQLARQHRENQIEDKRATLKSMKAHPETYVPEEYDEHLAEIDALERQPLEQVADAFQAQIDAARNSDSPEHRELVAAYDARVAAHLEPARPTLNEMIRRVNATHDATRKQLPADLDDDTATAAAEAIGGAVAGALDPTSEAWRGIARANPERAFEEIDRLRAGTVADRRRADELENLILTNEPTFADDFDGDPEQMTSEQADAALRGNVARRNARGNLYFDTGDDAMTADEADALLREQAQDSDDRPVTARGRDHG